MDNFIILDKLGAGSYSIVYKVERKIDKQIYALKKVKLSNLKEKEKQNALNEVRILASVKSSFVISYKEAFFDEIDSTLGIVMEFADNGDLYQKIVEMKKSKNYFEESEIWKIIIQLVEGLKSLHDLQILHRDIKSANVFLFSAINPKEKGEVIAKLGDLNVSKVARRGLGYTQTGTPYYASPEVWKDQPYNNKSDIWSLGCVIYEMVTLNTPFKASTMDELYKKVCKGEINKIPSKYSNDLFKIIQWLIQVDPEKRPSCQEILHHEIIKKRIEYFDNLNSEIKNENKIHNNNSQSLLKTIRIPKNLNFLSDNLPKPNYDTNTEANCYNNKNRYFMNDKSEMVSNSLPNIFNNKSYALERKNISNRNSDGKKHCLLNSDICNNEINIKDANEKGDIFDNRKLLKANLGEKYMEDIFSEIQKEEINSLKGRSNQIYNYLDKEIQNYLQRQQNEKQKRNSLLNNKLIKSINLCNLRENENNISKIKEQYKNINKDKENLFRLYSPFRKEGESSDRGEKQKDFISLKGNNPGSFVGYLKRSNPICLPKVKDIGGFNKKNKDFRNNDNYSNIGGGYKFLYPILNSPSKKMGIKIIDNNSKSIDLKKKERNRLTPLKNISSSPEG